MAPAPACRRLVIGLGNPLRGDDAAGPAVARRIAADRLPGVRVIEAAGLLPELAADLAAAGRVIFVDAAADATAVAAQAIEPRAGHALDHALRPATLLALAQLAFGHAPPAVLVTLPARDFGLGRPLSRATRRALPAAERAVRSGL
jgi:hydrogenase maturation protease